MEDTEQRVALCDLRDTALSLDEVLAAVRHPACGGVAIFVGVVRDHDHGNDVRSLDYSAHPTAVAALRHALVAVADAHPDVVRLAALHRTGHLDVGDLATVVAAAAPHRRAALAACSALIDTLKATVPIWKQQHFADGSDEWVGLP